MAFFCPYDHEDPAFRPAGRLPNLRYGDSIRAIWITRFDFHSRSDIARAMTRSALSGFNTVFFQVRGNATAYYRSKLEPWSEAYEWKDPGFDPLESAIAEAHARNMALHAWINVMPMWRGLHPPDNPQQMYNSNPEWSWYNQSGERQPLNRGFYVSINPCLPEARQHIVEVCKDIVSGYGIDGLHLDYIRFPNEPPVVNGRHYSRDKRTVCLFHADTGIFPEMDNWLWDQWRCDCVTALLRDIRHSVKSLRPQIVLTAAVGADKKQALSKFQDVDQWWKERLLDGIVPMNYTDCPKLFRSCVENQWQDVSYRHNMPLSTRLRRNRYSYTKGLMQKTELKEWVRPPEPAVIMGTSLEFGDTSLHKKLLSLSLKRFGHFSVFCYSSLFGLGCNNIVNKHCGLIAPFLRFIADTSVPFSSSNDKASNLHMERDRADVSNQLQFPQQALPELAFRHVNECSAELTIREKIKSKKIKCGLNIDAFKNNARRTFRRTLLRKQQKVYRNEAGWRSFLFDVTHGSLDPSQKGAYMMCSMKNWESVRMSEAIYEEDAECMAIPCGAVGKRRNFVSIPPYLLQMHASSKGKTSSGTENIAHLPHSKQNPVLDKQLLSDLAHLLMNWTVCARPQCETSRN